MKIKEIENGVEITGIKHFSPLHTFLCGQCFRWEEEQDNSFTGVAFGKVVNIKYINDILTIDNTNLNDFENIWRGYLDLDRDYGQIKDTLSKDLIIKNAIEYGFGIRILKQDFFECVISFIISANNNIPRIRGIINKISEMYGEKINYNGKTYYSFPTPESMKGIETSDIDNIKAGYRANYIVKTVEAFNNGEVIYEEIDKMPLHLARRELCKLMGVGNKVADCILLFSFGKFGAFPVDVWVKKVMGEYYNCSEKNVADEGYRLFGEYAGIAQQYLFYWMREK